MRPNLRPFSGLAQVCFALFATLVLAALQNITVDDAVSVGPVVPTYLPTATGWNIGNECPGCLVQPNASLAYDGTWHDCTFSPTNEYTQSIEFTFIGSGLYIFFILANTVPYATTLTYVQFVLDGVETASFSHNPTTSTNYEYNQPVYANSDIPFGQHTMTVMPVNDSVDNVLILFDYLVYTTDANTTTTISSGGPTSSQSPSPTSPSSATTSSGSNTGAIVGGTIAGIASLVLVTASILCCRRYKRRSGQSPPPIATVVEPFVLSSEMAPTSMQGATLPIQRMPIGAPLTESRPKHQPTASASSGAVQPLNTPPSSTGAAQPLNPPSNSTQPSNVFPHSAAAEILEQVGILRDEISRLRRHQDMGQNTFGVGSEPPPEYT